MEILNLRAIELLVADPNLSRAAERLGMTQSALSKRLQSIEAEIGFPLFERRGPRGLAPLPQALELAHLSERITQTWTSGVNRIKRAAEEPEHFVLVGPPLFLREIFLPWWVEKSSAFPQLRLEVQTSSLDRVSLEMLEMHASAAILERKEELPEFICKPIYTERWGIVRHPSAANKDLEQCLWGTYSTAHNPVDTWLVQRQKIAPPQYHVYWQDLTALAIWVSETPGAASVLPWHTVAWLCKRKKLDFEPLGADATTKLYLSYPQHSPHRALIKEMIEISASVPTM